jgi:hypothetical protein
MKIEYFVSWLSPCKYIFIIAGVHIAATILIASINTPKLCESNSFLDSVDIFLALVSIQEISVLDK